MSGSCKPILGQDIMKDFYGACDTHHGGAQQPINNIFKSIVVRLNVWKAYGACMTSPQPLSKGEGPEPPARNSFSDMIEF